MKNVSLIINAVLAVAIIILFVLVLGNRDKKNDSGVAFAATDSLSQSMPIAYINVDTLLLNYKLAQEAYEVLTKKGEDSRVTLNSRMRQLQNEVADFQRKLENNAFLSRERAEKEQTRLMQKQEEIQVLEAKLTQELMTEQQKVNEQLRDTIDAFLREYNKSKKYEMIFGNTGSEIVLLANPAYDITAEVVEMLNIRLAK